MKRTILWLALALGLFGLGLLAWPALDSNPGAQSSGDFTTDSTGPQVQRVRPVPPTPVTQAPETAPEPDSVERAALSGAIRTLADAFGGTGVVCDLTPIGRTGNLNLARRQSFERLEGDAMAFVAEEVEGSQVVFDTSAGAAGLLVWETGPDGPRCRTEALELQEVGLPRFPGVVVLVEGGGCASQGVTVLGPEPGTLPIAQSGRCFATLVDNGRSASVDLANPRLDANGEWELTFEEGVRSTKRVVART